MKFGIIGLGNHAINRVMPAIKSSGHSVTAIYSRSLKKAEKEGASYGAKAFSDLDALFTDGDFDAVYIASPNFLHYEQARLSMENGKDVLLEKQMTLSNGDASDLVRISTETGRRLAVGFHMRFHPAVAEIRNMISGGKFGTITLVQGTWGGLSQGRSDNPDRRWWTEDEKVGGGSVMGTGVHVLDTINFLLGSWPGKISAYRQPAKAVIDNTEAISMEYNSIIAHAVSSRAMKHPRNDLVVYGTEATAVARDVFSTTVNSDLEIDGKIAKTFREGNLYEEEIRAFADMVKGKKSNIATVKDGEAVVKIVNAAFLSDTTGKVTTP
ncbi:MAG: Gfo/Idh/MocA family oxidoreductase [Thermoplasmataceae archaeon]